MQRAVLFLAAVAVLVAAANAAWVETAYTATLTPDQVVPATSGAEGFGGAAVCILDRNSNPHTLDCEVQTDVDDVSTLQIHRGSRGSNGAIIYSFDTTYQQGFHVRQVVTLVDFYDYTVDQQVSDFLNGQWYLTVGSNDFSGGGIRGQIEHSDRVYSRMDVSNTIPRSSGSSATGVALATYTFFTPARTLQLDFVHNVQKPTGVEIRLGRPGEVGPLVYFFTDARSSVFHSVQYTISEEDDLLDDLQYIQILSQKNPNGEIRGQLIGIDYVPEIAFTSRLSGGQEVPSTNTNNRGCGLVAYDCLTRTLEYLVMHNVPDATGAFVHAAPENNNGAVLFALENFISPIYGSVQLTLEEELILYTQQMYFNIASEDFNSGEIRGQITVEADWWAYLSGTNVVPPVTTEAVGCATFFLDGEQNRILNYDIHHSVATPQEVTLEIGQEGQNGDLDLVFPSIFSPIRGDSFVLDDDDLEAFVTESSYVTVLSEAYPFIGEVRGQIKRVNPCRATNDNSLTLSVSGVDEGPGFTTYEATSQFTPNGSPRSNSNNSPNSPNSPNTNSATFSFTSYDTNTGGTISGTPRSGTPIRVGLTPISTQETFSRRFLPPESMFSPSNVNGASSLSAPIYFSVIFAAFLLALF